MMYKKREKKADNTLYDYEFLFKESEQRGGNPSNILIALLKSNKWKLCISSILFIIKASATWIIPIVTANVINAAYAQNDSSLKTMVINILILFVVILQNIPTHTLYAQFTNKMLRNIGAGLRNTLIKKLQHLSITYHKEIESGKIQSKFLRDIEAIEFLNNHFAYSIIPSIINIVIAISICAYNSRTVTIFFLVVIPANVFLVTMFKKKMKLINKNFRRETENISAKVSNMLDMIPVTKAHGLENEEIARIENNIKALREKGLIFDRVNAYFGSSTWVLSQSLSALCLLFTGYLALKGKIPVGNIVIYQTYFTTINNTVQNLVNIYGELTKGLESIRSVSEIMLSDNVEDNRNKIKLRYVHGTVEFRDVCYHYPNEQKNVIDHFNLKVEPGECIAFVGASGSGKSTIMNMIIGFLKATEGEILIDGKPIDELSLSDYRHFISVVPQNSILFTGSIKENITYGLTNVPLEKFDKVIKLANIDEFTEKLPNGIDTVIGEHGDKLSGGQKQRISIARALIRDPKILILDEATSALDNVSEYHVQKAMSELIKGRTTFIVAHRLSTIRDADKIVVMDNGRCVEFGTYNELMQKKGKFYELKTLSDLD